MFRFWSYLTFLLRSKNQHGIHSPFVFAYLTRCLYKRMHGRYGRSEKIALKSIPYFNYRSILLLSTDQDLISRLNTRYPDLRFGRSPYDLVYIGKDQLLETDLNALLPHCHENSMILTEGIHQTRRHHSIWVDFRDNSGITVSVDYFYGGLLFLRKAQARQHFRIRI